mmetsp:Transcript_25636/g.52234  ORF Transcript_25636/g.52234 Transcript_25636/m.52234 type:complete len:147 (+) Transcript_25636:848-1288(+)
MCATPTMGPDEDDVLISASPLKARVFQPGQLTWVVRNQSLDCKGIIRQSIVALWKDNPFLVAGMFWCGSVDDWIDWLCITLAHSISDFVVIFLSGRMFYRCAQMFAGHFVVTFLSGRMYCWIDRLSTSLAHPIYDCLLLCICSGNI